MFWIVWVGIGAFVALLLAVSWWYDRDARRRGATPLRAGAMNRARRNRDLEIRREMAQVNGKGITPRGQDAFRDAWRGKDGPGGH